MEAQNFRDGKVAGSVSAVNSITMQSARVRTHDVALRLKDKKPGGELKDLGAVEEAMCLGSGKAANASHYSGRCFAMPSIVGRQSAFHKPKPAPIAPIRSATGDKVQGYAS